jgi:hypothetical protein
LYALTIRNRIQATTKKFTSAVKNAPYGIGVPFNVNVSWSKLTSPPKIAAMKLSTTLVNAVTTPANARARIRPTAISRRFPFMTKSLNSFSIAPLSSPGP